MRGSRLLFLLVAILLAAPAILFAGRESDPKGAEKAMERMYEARERRAREAETGGGRLGEGTAESAARSSAPAAPTKPETKPVVTEAKPAPSPETKAKSAPSSMFPDQKFSDTQNGLKDATTPQEVLELSIDWNAAYQEHTGAGQSQKQDRSDGDTIADLAEEVLEEVASQEALEALATKSERVRKALEMLDKVPTSADILLDVLDPTATATHQQEKASLDKVIQRDVSRKLIELLPPEAIHRLPDELPEKGPIIRRPRP